MHTETRVHTRACMDAYMYTLMHKHTNAHAQSHLCTHRKHGCTCTQTRLHTQAHTDTYMYTLTHKYTQAHQCTCTHRHTRTLTGMHAETPVHTANTEAHACTQTRACTHMYTLTHKHTGAHAQGHVHTLQTLTHVHALTHMHTLTHTCSYAARLDIHLDSDLLTNTGKGNLTGSRLRVQAGVGWPLKGRTGLTVRGPRAGGAVGTAGAPIQGPWAEGRGTGGLLGQGGWAGCRPQGAGVADGRAWESRQAPWPCGGVGHDGGCAKAETGVVGVGVRTRR